MLWFLVWVVLGLVAVGVLALVGRSLWRKSAALARELGEAAERLSDVTEALSAASQPPPAHPGVFASPAGLRAERYAAKRQRLWAARRARFWGLD